jgi:hypothetical protein
MKGAAATAVPRGQSVLQLGMKAAINRFYSCGWVVPSFSACLGVL